MRINQFIAKATGMSRRAADAVIAEQRVRINDRFAQLGDTVHLSDRVTLDGRDVVLPITTLTIMLNKPVGYVCSREGQGSQTIYELLPEELHHLKPVGRLDKDSSGLLLLTDNGTLAHRLTHPSFQKSKVYEIELDKALSTKDQKQIETGVELEDGTSQLQLSGKGRQWKIIMHEGRNRQIRRTFAALDYKVTKLHRIQLGKYRLGSLGSSEYIVTQQ